MPLTHIEAMYSTVPMVASQKCALIRPTDRAGHRRRQRQLELHPVHAAGGWNRGQRHQLLEGWNATAAEYPLQRGVHRLFEEQVERTYTLLAIPFFLLSGAFMTTGGVARRLIDFAKSSVPQGLPHRVSLLHRHGPGQEHRQGREARRAQTAVVDSLNMDITEINTLNQEGVENLQATLRAWSFFVTPRSLLDVLFGFGIVCEGQHRRFVEALLAADQAQSTLVDAVHADVLASHAAQAAAVEHGTGGIAR